MWNPDENPSRLWCAGSANGGKKTTLTHSKGLDSEISTDIGPPLYNLEMDGD